MNDMAQVLMALSVGGSVLTISRRFRNSSKGAGEGVAGWTMVLIVLAVLKFLFPELQLLRP